MTENYSARRVGIATLKKTYGFKILGIRLAQITGNKYTRNVLLILLSSAEKLYAIKALSYSF
jgi:hypothetical protein